MKTVHTITELRSLLAAERANGKRIGLVPTMGNLHDGHLSLVHQAAESCDIIVATIFVNPLQFGAGEDLERYPRTLAQDQQKLVEAGCHYLFAPSDQEMYPNGRDNQTEVIVPKISLLHCGASRPGHFEGVATVVSKLFGIVQPDVAVFGEKDFQQLQVIRQLTADLYLPVEVQGAPIARDSRGLALSSRNGYLTPEELDIAPALNTALRDTRAAIQAGRRDFRTLEEEAQQALERAGFQRDFFNIVRQNDLLAADENDSQLVILAAGHLGRARLIDNIVVEL
ncbi:MAG: pantoate--beta-alanine ligase [Marinobacterium sp.]|nr:pantoate--beta-alanine ligase [Marinobacterium sp.]